MAKTAEDKVAEKLAKEAEQTASDTIADKTPEELKADSDRVEAELQRKADEKRKIREAQAETKDSDKMYSKAEVLEFIKKAVADERKKEEMGMDSLDDEDPYEQKQLKLPRFQNKFIFAFENTNTDEYFPDAVVHAFDVYNEKQRRNEPWVKVVFEDGSKLSVPLYTVIEKSQKVLCDIVEIIEKDTSYSAGRVEQAEVKDYSRKGTGNYVKVKVTQADYSYKVRLPNSDKEVIVGREVVNW